MKIGIDITGLGVRKEGIVSYTTNVTSNMLTLGSDHTFYLYCRNELPVSVREAVDEDVLKSVKVRFVGASNRKIAQQVFLPSAAKADDLDVLFYPFNSAAFRSVGRSVVTIHDLQPYILPEEFSDVHSSRVYRSSLKSAFNSWYWRATLKSSSIRSTRVIAVSHATKRDIVDIFGVPEERVDVVYEGVNHAQFNLTQEDFDPDEFRRRYDLPTRYLLCVGLNPYKNIDGVLDAFKLAKGRIHDDIKLVLVGTNYWGDDKLAQMISSRKLDDHVVYGGFFPDEDLKYLYQNAEIFLFPSFYEGFGLPILEAFACGTPVVTSTTRGSAEEIAGGAAWLANPRDVQSIADGIVSLSTDADLRRNKIEAGLARASEFSWKSAAEGTLRSLESAVPS